MPVVTATSLMASPGGSPGVPTLVATSCGTAVAAVCALGLFEIERLLGGIWSLAAVLVAGLGCALLARVLAHLVEVVPSGASLLAYVSRAFGRSAGIAVVAPYLLLTLFLVGAEATIVGLVVDRLLPVPMLPAALAFLLIAWLVCRAGIRIGHLAQAVSTWALIGGLGALALVPVVGAATRGELGTRLVTSPPTVMQFVAGVGQALFLFMGFELVTAQVEVASPRAVGRALGRSVVILAGFYGLLALGFSCLSRTPRIPSGSFVPQLALAEEVGGTPALVLIAILTVLASFSSFTGVLLSLSRFASAVARQGALPRRMASVEARTLVPRNAMAALLLVGMTAVVLVRFGGMLGPSILAAAVSTSLTYASVVWARQRDPFAGAGRGRATRLAGAVLALGLAGFGAGVIVEAGSMWIGTLALLVVAYTCALTAALRVPRRTRLAMAPLAGRGSAHAD